MLNRRNVARRGLALLLGPALLVVVGCSDDGVGKRFPVSGTVKYKGQPVSKARINFVNKGAGAPGAYGTVENGVFSSLTTVKEGDGALPGDYVVTVDTREIDDAKIKAQAGELAAKHNMEGKTAVVPPELQARALKDAKTDIPGKYQLPETTDLKATVKEEKNKFDFELKD
ncbi:MAG: hypothetical protein ACYC61_02510 [Isosphaeraceae bacterium]